MCALPHALQAEPRLAPFGDVEPGAPIPHAKHQMAIGREEPDGRSPGLRMTCDVSEGLLRHPVDAQGQFLGEGLRDVVGPEPDHDAVALEEAETLRPQGIDDAQLVQDGRVKLAGQGMDPLGQGRQLLAHATRPRLDVGGKARQLLEHSGLDRQDGQPLRQVVVQLPRDAAVLLLLGVHEPRASAPCAPPQPASAWRPVARDAC